MIRPLRLLVACAVFLGGLAWAIHLQFGVDEVHRADDAVNVPLAIPPATIHDWPGELGSDGTGRCPRERLPHENYDSGKLSWRTAVPGSELGGPCVWGKLVVIPIVDPATRTLSLAAFRIDNGESAWTTPLATNLDLRSDASRYVATPACDGQAVYVAAAVAGRLRLFSVSLGGRLSWDRDAGPMACADGRLVSPLVFESLVIVSAEHPGTALNLWRSSSHLTAIHRLTGEIVYRIRRPNGDGRAAPVLAKIGERSQLIVPARGRITAYDPRSGERLWWFQIDSDRAVSSVAWDSARIYAGGSDPSPQVVAIRADGAGDVSETHRAWQNAAAGSSVIALVRHRDFVLCLNDDGVLTALDAATGKVQWRKSLPGTFARPPIPAGDDLLCLSLQGKAYVLDLTQRGNVVGEWHLPGGIVAPPAATFERLVARDREGLFCLPLADRETPPIVTAPQRPTKRL